MEFCRWRLLERMALETLRTAELKFRWRRVLGRTTMKTLGTVGFR
ncbi:hypothetical protein A2U01_0105781, partial [Trifolium medium]|nr:hypothetical protein [Trifolium medium]